MICQMYHTIANCRDNLRKKEAMINHMEVGWKYKHQEEEARENFGKKKRMGCILEHFK